MDDILEWFKQNCYGNMNQDQIKSVISALIRQVDELKERVYELENDKLRGE